MSQMILQTKVMRLLEVDAWRAGGVRLAYTSAEHPQAPPIPVHIELTNQQANDLLKAIKAALSEGVKA